jgi:hypothetical protein
LAAVWGCALAENSYDIKLQKISYLDCKVTF